MHIFFKLCVAYEVLSDEDKRRQYDQFGEAAFTQGGSSGSPFTGQGFHDFHKFFQDSNMFFANQGSGHRGSGGRRHSAKSTMFDFDDIFNSAPFDDGRSGFERMFHGFDDMSNMFNWESTNFGGFGDGNHHRNQYSKQHQRHDHFADNGRVRQNSRTGKKLESPGIPDNLCCNYVLPSQASENTCLKHVEAVPK